MNSDYKKGTLLLCHEDYRGTFSTENALVIIDGLDYIDQYGTKFYKGKHLQQNVYYTFTHSFIQRNFIVISPKLTDFVRNLYE